MTEPRFPHYEVIERLARGGMCTVTLVREQRLGRAPGDGAHAWSEGGRLDRHLGPVSRSPMR